MASSKRRVLEYQADRIEAVLAQHKVSARVTGGLVSPRWVRFQVLPAMGTRVSKIKNLAEELALGLGTDTCRISRHENSIAIEIPRDDPEIVHLLPLQKKLIESARDARNGGIPFGAAVLGLAEDGAPLLVKLPSPTVAHILVAGTTGSGKSALAQTIITSLALTHRPSQIGFILIDPKRRAFGPLARLPHLMRPVMSELEEIEAALQGLVALMLERDGQGVSEPKVVVVIDELADLIIVGGSDIADLVTRLAQRGREAGIHLVACTQKPSSALVGPLATANFPVRLVGSVVSADDAKVAAGVWGTGAEKLRGPGDFIAVVGGQTIRFQAAYVSRKEIEEIVSEIAFQFGEASSQSLPITPRPAVQQEEPARVDTDKLAEYVELARPIWCQVRRNGGGLRYGGKAEIAEVLFDDRSTAGHQGRWVDRVVECLEAEESEEKQEDEELDPGLELKEVETGQRRYQASAPMCFELRQPTRWVARKTVFSARKSAKATTTTTLKQALLRPKGSDRAFSKVVVVFESPV